MGSKTPITHALSWYILSVIDFCIGQRRTADWPPPRERPVWHPHCAHWPRFSLMGACCWLGQGATPHLPGLLPERLP
jgi:hypothetical protein